MAFEWNIKKCEYKVNTWIANFNLISKCKKYCSIESKAIIKANMPLKRKFSSNNNIFIS